MKICFIAKYPPLVGGFSTRTYWETQLLAKGGVDVHIVSNATEAQDQYKFCNFEEPSKEVEHLLENIKVHTPKPLKISYIPYANPFVSRLAGIATHVVQKYSCDLIMGAYFEPNGVAAALVSQATDVPYGIRHAGSDVGYLYKMTELQPTYHHMLQHAHCLLFSSANIPFAIHEHLDVSKVYNSYFFTPLRDYFNPFIKKLDFKKLLQDISNNMPASFNGSIIYQFFANKKIDVSLPTIGIYGKASVYKGHTQLISALGILKKKGFKFNFIFLLQGSNSYLEKIKNEIQKNDIEENTFILPFLPPWLIPNFIKACDCICYLEHDFPISNHFPIIPIEVLSCGTYLILSDDTARRFIKSDNYFSIVNPRDINSLYLTIKNVITNVEKYKVKALQGYQALVEPGQHDAHHHSFKIANFYEELLGMARSQKRKNKAVVALNNMNEFLLEKKDSALPPYDLEIIVAELEKIALEQKKLVLMGFFKRIFKVSFQIIDKDEMLSIFNSYFSDSKSVLDKESHEHAIQFGNYAQENFSRKKNQAVASDIILYELIFFKLSYYPYKIENYKSNITIDFSDSTLVPNLSQGIVMQNFQCDILNIISQANKENINISNEAKKYTLLFTFNQTYRQVYIFLINTSTQSLINAINGVDSLSKLLLYFATKTSQADIQTSFKDTIEFLYNNEIVEF